MTFLRSENFIFYGPFLCFFVLSSVANALSGLNGTVRDASPSDRLEAVGRLSNGCTGTLIRTKIVLSAGHCVGFKSGAVDDGSLMIEFPESSNPSKEFVIVKTAAASKGKFPTRYLDHSGQDYSLLLLKEEVKFIAPMALFTGDGKIVIERLVQLAGFGRYQLVNKNRCYGEGAKKLKVAEAKIIERLSEEGRWGVPLIIQNPSLAICSGDSGGPAIYKEKGTFQIVGVTSGPYNPPDSGNIGVSFQYADISSALKWLSEEISKIEAG